MNTGMLSSGSGHLVLALRSCVALCQPLHGFQLSHRDITAAFSCCGFWLYYPLLSMSCFIIYLPPYVLIHCCGILIAAEQLEVGSSSRGVYIGNKNDLTMLEQLRILRERFSVLG